MQALKEEQEAKVINILVLRPESDNGTLNVRVFDFIRKKIREVFTDNTGINIEIFGLGISDKNRNEPDHFVQVLEDYDAHALILLWDGPAPFLTYLREHFPDLYILVFSAASLPVGSFNGQVLKSYSEEIANLGHETDVMFGVMCLHFMTNRDLRAPK